jgi:hypothetical protein
MPAASASASTRCRPPADPGSHSAGTSLGRLACAAHKIAEFALHNATAEWRSRRRRYGHVRKATAKRLSLFSLLASLFRREVSLFRLGKLPAPFEGISQIPRDFNRLSPTRPKISLPSGKITETQMAGPGAVPGAGHGSLRIAAGRRRLRLLGSDRIVHLELDRMRRMLEIVHLFPFQLDIRFDEIAAEHIAFHQKGVIGLQFAQRVA